MYSLNVEQLIPMSVDTVNGYINVHFLNRLLKIIVDRNNLGEFNVDFTGPDAARAERVYTGLPDDKTYPLSREFTLSRDDDDMVEFVKPSIASVIAVDNEENHEFKPTIPLRQDKFVFSVKDAIPRLEIDKIDDSGAINLRALKQFETMISENVITSNSMIQTMKDIMVGVNEMQNKIDSLTEELHMHSLKIHNIETKPDNTNTISIRSNDESLPTQSSSNSSSIPSFYRQLSMPNKKKKVQIIQSPTFIIQPKMYTSNTIDRSNINSTPVAIDEFEDNSRVDMPKLNHFQFATDKYIIKNHQPHNVLKHVEKLLGRLSKIECKVELLMENALNNSKVINEDLPDDEYFSNLEEDIENEIQIDLGSEEGMLRLAKLRRQPVTLFKKLFGVKQKSNERLTVRRFHEFYNEFTNKFQIIHDFLSAFSDNAIFNKSKIEQLVIEKANENEFVTFKNHTIAAYRTIITDIEQYILRDPEALGVVQYVEGTCASCAQPARIKTNSNTLPVLRNDYKPRPSTVVERTFERAKIRRRRNQVPGTMGVEDMVSSVCDDPTNPIQKCKDLFSDMRQKKKNEEVKKLLQKHLPAEMLPQFCRESIMKSARDRF